jgi:hypothetical protein
VRGVDEHSSFGGTLGHEHLEMGAVEAVEDVNTDVLGWPSSPAAFGQSSARV